MKPILRTTIIILSYVFICFIGCLIFAFVQKIPSSLVLPHDLFGYKFLNGFLYFIDFLPSICCTGILIGFTMLGCFFSGMMGITMKYVIDKNIPIINKLNPANMITDGFYALYYYDTLDRYYSNILSLCIFSGIMLTIAIVTLRKQKYESI